MTADTPTPRPRAGWIVPVIASLASLAVGATSYLVTAPLATPRVIPPEVVIVDQLTLGDGFTPLEDVAAAGEPLLGSTTVLHSDAVADAAATLGAALDAAGGVATGEGPADPAPIGVRPVDDPCPAAGDPEASCPEGSRATVLANVAPPALQIWAGAAVTADCLIEPTTTSVGYRLVTTVPVSVSARYVDGGRDHTEAFATSADARSDWGSAGEDSGEWPTVTHCVTLTGLTAGWSGRLTLTATATDGSVAVDTVDLDTAPGQVVPPSFVRPLTNTALMVSVPGTASESARFHAIAVPFGQPAASCDFGEGADVLDPVTTVTESVTAEQLEAARHLPEYVRRDAAFFVVPEASTVTVCAGIGGASGWTVPDSTFSEVLHSPDLVLPVVTVEGFEPAPGVRANEVSLTARTDLDAAPCGTWELRADDGVLCDYRPLDGAYVGWDAALTVTVRGSALDSTAERIFVAPVSPQTCGLGCELPPTAYVDVPVSFRDPCLGDGCPASFLGTVRLRVDWEHGARSWFGDWLREDAPVPSSDAPQMETLTSPVPVTEVGADGDLYASVPIETDVPTSAAVEAYRLEEGGDPVLVAEWSGPDLAESHTATLGPLEGGGAYYGFRVRLTDADGDTAVYSWLGGEERSWARGVLHTPTADVAMKAEVTVRAADGAAIAVGVAGLDVGGNLGWRQPGTRIDDVVCGTGDVTVPFDTEVADIAGRNPTTGVTLRLQVSPLGENGVDATGCTWRGPRPPAEVFVAEIPYRDILDGATVTVTNASGYAAVIRLTPAG
jgi:hypothetical protein